MPTSDSGAYRPNNPVDTGLTGVSPLTGRMIKNTKSRRYLSLSKWLVKAPILQKGKYIYTNKPDTAIEFLDLLAPEKDLLTLYATEPIKLRETVEHLTLYLCNVTLILKKMGCRVAIIQDNYPEVYDFIKNYFDDMRPQSVQLIRNELEKFIADPIPHTLREVGKSMSMNIRYLRIVAPDLCSQISQKRAVFEKTRYEHRILEQENRIRNCCEQLRSKNQLTWPTLINTLEKSGCLKNPRLKAVAASYF